MVYFQKTRGGIDIRPEIVIGQIFGAVAPLVTFISYQVNSKKKLLLLQTAATVATCLSYLLLGASSGFALNIVCILRNVIFFFQNSKSKVNRVSAVLLALLMGGLAVLSWEGPISLLLVIALAANTVFLSFGDAQLLRFSIFATSTMVLFYNIFIPTPSFGGIFNESVALVAAAVGTVTFYKRKGKKCSA